MFSSLIKVIWGYRHYVLSSIVNDFKTKIVGSKLGFLWLIIHPLTQVLMYALVLSAVLATKLPGIESQFSYAIYLTAGILGWTLFSELITRCLTIFIDNGNLMNKMAFPRICLPIIVSGTALLNNVLLFITVIIIFSALGHYPGAALLWLPLVVFITLIFSLGLGMILGMLNVFMRDIGQLTPIILQFGFWFTPIVYPASIIPESYSSWLNLNPLYHLISGYQNILVYNKPPQIEGLVVVGLISLIVFITALIMFRSASREMVDVL